MSIYHLNKSSVARSKGGNAVESASYISGSKLTYRTIDKETGAEINIEYDYSNKKGLAYSKILAPDNMPAWAINREQLWNKCEAIEERVNSRTAHKLIGALPRELTLEQNIELVEEFVEKYLVSEGMIADTNIHYDNENNPHLHIQMTTRELRQLESGERTFSDKKNRDWQSIPTLRYQREKWAEAINKHLELHGHLSKVSHLSHKARGIELIPGVHEGPARYMKKAELYTMNQQIMKENADLIRNNPELVFQKLSINKPVFTKEDIAIALSDALVISMGFEIEIGAKDNEHEIPEGEVKYTTEAKRKDLSELSKQLVNQEMTGSISATTTAIKIDNLEVGKTESLKAKEEIEEQNKLAASNNNEAASQEVMNDDIESLNTQYSQEFLTLYSKLLQSDKIKLINPCDLKGRTLYALADRVELEKRFINAVEKLANKYSHNLAIDDSAIDTFSTKEQFVAKGKEIGFNIQEQVNDKTGLNIEVFGKKAGEYSREQRVAIKEICNGSDISVLQGYPGAGKTFVMKEIVRQYKKAGYRVIGTGPSSVSAMVLGRATGIKSQNTALWRKDWQKAKGHDFELALRSNYYTEEQYQEEQYLKSLGCDGIFGSEAENIQLDGKTVLIVDEASMIELANMDYLTSEVEKAGAKKIDVGDSNQFAAVGMTGAFNKISKIANVSRITEVMRHQHADEQVRSQQRLATQLVGKYKMSEALEIYNRLEMFNVSNNPELAKEALVKDYVQKYLEQAESLKRDDLASVRSVVIGAYTNKAVNYFNIEVRERLKQAGILKGSGAIFKSGSNETIELLKGEQIVFETNKVKQNGFNGVLNGEVATVIDFTEPDDKGAGLLKLLVHRSDGNKEIVRINTSEEKQPVRFKHAYAVTGYKLQGETVDYLKVYYESVIGYEAFNVLMSRYKYDMKMYLAKDVLENLIYNRMDADAAKAREKYGIEAYTYVHTVEDGKEIREKEEVPAWLIGLLLSVNKRTDNNFALDYQLHEKLSGNEVILKRYLETRELVFDLHGGMQEWKKDQEAPFKLTNLKSSIVNSVDIKFKDVRELAIDPYNLMYTQTSIQREINKEIEKQQKENDKNNHDQEIDVKAERAALYQQHIQSCFQKLANQKESEGGLYWNKLKKADQAVLIWHHLPKYEKEKLTIIFEKLTETKDKLKGHAFDICNNYHGWVDLDLLDQRNKTFEELKQLELLNKDSEISSDINLDSNSRLHSHIQRDVTSRTLKEKQEQLDEINIAIQKASLGIKTNLTNSQVTMGDRTLQLNLNYETIRKHAELSEYKFYLTNIHHGETLFSNPSWKKVIEICHKLSLNEQSLIISNNKTKTNDYITAMQEQSQGNHQLSHIEIFIDNLTVLNADIIENQELLAEKTELLNTVKDEERELNKKADQITQYKQELFPNFLKRVYKTNPEKVIEKWQEFKTEQAGKQTNEIINLVKSKPQTLGDLKGIGLGQIFGINQGRKDAITNLEVLAKRFKTYEESGKRMIEIQNQLAEKDYKILTDNLEQEIENLKKTLPNKYEQAFLEKVDSLQNKGELNVEKLSEFAASDAVQDLIYEYYNNINDKFVNTANDREVLQEKKLNNELSTEISTEVSIKEKGQDTNPSDVSYKKNYEKNSTPEGARQRNRERKNNEFKNNRLDFNEIKNQLTKSDYANIFETYAARITDNKGNIKRKGDEISLGSLGMNISNGVWFRHSSGEKGDIFKFVKCATNCSFPEALERVAEIAGIKARDNTRSSFNDHNNNNIKDSVTLDKTSLEETKPLDVWVAKAVVPISAPEFIPEKHLYGMLLTKEVQEIYPYKNVQNELIGYTVRFINKEEGSKEVLPVSYCYNELQNKEGWKLKGFSDSGNKPIYGVEKIGENINKPILIVEGEKSCNKAQQLFPEYSVLSWMGGSQAADKVNWQVLAGKKIIIWPDNDMPGAKAAKTISQLLNKANGHIGNVTIIDPNHLKFKDQTHINIFPEKWDLADDIPKDVTLEDIKEAIANRQAEKLSLSDIAKVSSKLDNITSPSLNNTLHKSTTAQRMLWQGVVMGIFSSAEQIQVNAAIEDNWREKLSSEDAKNYMKYAEIRAIASSNHDFLAYDNPLYQDTLVAISVNNKNINKGDREPLELPELIKEMQYEYSKKAKSLDSFYATHETYRKYDQQLEKTYSSSHDKVQLYRTLVRDVTLLHQEQMGINIRDLPITHHEKIAQEIYNNVNSYKANNGKGRDHNKLEEHDTVEIATKSYKGLCSSEQWEKIANNEMWRTRVFMREAQELKQFVPERIAEIHEISRSQGVLAATDYCKGLNNDIQQIPPQLEKFKKEKDTTKSLLGIFEIMSKEHQYCQDIAKKFNLSIDKQLTIQSMEKPQENNSDYARKYIQNILKTHQDNPNLIDQLKKDCVFIMKSNSSDWSKENIIDKIKVSENLSEITKEIHHHCLQSLVNDIHSDLKQLEGNNSVHRDNIKYDSTKDYLDHILQDKNLMSYFKNTKQEKILNQLHQREQIKIDHTHEELHMRI